MAVFFLRFLDPITNALLFDTPLLTFSMDVGLNQSTRWTASIPLSHPDVELIFQGLTIQVYADGELFFEGILQDFPPSFTELESITLSGRSFIDNLYSGRSYPLSYYDDKPILGIMHEILYLHNWAAGSIGTMPNTGLTTTVDLRGESNALTQLNKFLSGLQRIYWREGETRLGKRTIDLGNFQEDSGITALFAGDYAIYEGDEIRLHTIQSLSYRIDFTKALYAIRLAGGPVLASAGVERAVTLGDAFGVDSLLRINTSYPIIEDLNEKEWSVVNLVDYPYPGGQVLSTETLATSSTWAIGDLSGGAVENWRHLMFTFVPYPGILRHITIWIGTRDANFVSEFGTVFDVYWKIFELNPADNRTLGDLVYTGLFDHLPENNEIMRLVPDVAVTLEAGKQYGLVIGTTVAPVLDVVTMTFKIGNRATASEVFEMCLRDNLLPTTGTVFNAGAIVPIMEVITDPIATINAGALYEKQEKFAPPKTGSVVAAAEINRAGKALYEYGIQKLLENVPEQKEYTMEVVGTKYLAKPGDTIYVQGTARVEWFDPISGMVERITYADIAADLRVISYSVALEGETIRISYRLLDGDGILKSDRLLSLYDKVAERKPPVGGVFPSPWGLVLDTITTVVGPQLADSEFDDGALGVEVEVSIFDGTVPSLPTLTEGVYLAGNPYGTSTSGQLRIEVLEEPTFDSSGIVRFRVGLVNRDWEYGDVANMTIKLIWR